ncbi:MAG: hypothetical protein RLZZ365_819 [Pseudomonadota bacterium]|jgi:hypothetical protein
MLFKYLYWRSAAIVIASLLLTACLGSVSQIPKTEIAPPQSIPSVRAPALGQQWVYEVRNVFNGELVDILTETVVSVGPKVQIAREGKKLGKLPDEIQEPWGIILQDPHWTPPQRFTKAVPLWPQELKPGWSGFYRTRYQVLGFPDNDFYWGLTIQANAWNRIKTQAGEFDALYYVSTADYFESDDFMRYVNNRRDQVWFAPQIGRWVVRESFGEYLWLGMTGWSQSIKEDYLRWELIAWK